MLSFFLLAAFILAIVHALSGDADVESDVGLSFSDLYESQS
jgi:hypothetical protein